MKALDDEDSPSLSPLGFGSRSLKTLWAAAVVLPIAGFSSIPGPEHDSVDAMRKGLLRPDRLRRR
ncbi:MAG: hypothetical protein ABSF23_13610 [Terracidiphilus sp.]